MFPLCWQNFTLTYFDFTFLGSVDLGECSAPNDVAMSLEWCFGLGHPEMTELFRLFKLAKTIHTHYDQNLRLMNYAHYEIKHGNGKIHHLVRWFSQQTKPSLIYRGFPSNPPRLMTPEGRPSLIVHHFYEWFRITPACYRFMAASVYHITPKNPYRMVLSSYKLVYKPHWHPLTLVISTYIYHKPQSHLIIKPHCKY